MDYAVSLSHVSDIFRAFVSVFVSVFNDRVFRPVWSHLHSCETSHLPDCSDVCHLSLVVSSLHVCNQTDALTVLQS